jgi:hypothetical protein
MHAWQCPGCAGVDRADEAVSGRASQKSGLEKPRRVQVIDETTGTANKVPILNTRIASSNVWLWSHAEMSFSATLSAAMADVSQAALTAGIEQVAHKTGAIYSIVTPLALIVAAQFATSAPMNVFRYAGVRSSGAIGATPPS